MNITIEELERNLDGGVKVVHWIATKTQGEHTAYAYGTCEFEPDASHSGFVSFDSLTESQVISWVEAAIDTGDIVQHLDDMLAEKVTPQTLTGLPDNWRTT